MGRRGARAVGGAPRILPLSVLAALLLCASLAHATDYYVRPSGNDSAAGTSVSTAWRTIGKVNAQSFVAGDRILFEGGQSFSGSLSFDAGDAGSAPNPITISSFGSGRATINAGSAYGLYAYNTAGLTISRLDFIGPGASSSTGAGITFYNELAGNVRLAHVHLDDVDVSGFRRGVSIGGWNGTSGYDDVRVTNSALHDNQRSGMTVYAQNRYGVTDVYVAGCAFYDNLGDPNDTTSNSGNGIVLGQVDGAVIERSLAWNNGQLCTAPEGPIGIWAYESTDVTIQLCESWSNRTGGSADGGGFGFDGGTTASVLQYNYSHDNDGAAFGLYQYGGAPAWGANVVRYNISENDGRKNGYGAINVWNGGTGMSGCEIYGNTIYTSPAPPNTPHAVRISTTVSNFHFRNNILMAVGGARLFAAPQGLSGLALQGNDYFTAGGAFTIAYAGTTYTTLGAFVAATGHEKVGATVVGRNVDPLLTFAGNGGTVADPDLLAALPAYKLTSASPLVDGGLDLTGLFGLAPGPRDFFAMSLPEGGGFDVGAHEFHAPGAACDGQGDPDMDGDGICDADDTCPDTPDPAQADGDGDAVGDACDPCTNSAPTSVAKPRVLVSGLNSGESDDKLKISASIHGVPSLPSIDPAANGLRILALSATGESVIDAMIPGGAYDPLTRAGWTTAPSGLVWKYSNAGTAVPLAGGISRVVIKAIAKTPGLYKVSIMGADADYDAATDLPLLPVVVLDPPFARDGQCAEMHFDGPAPLPSCSLVSQGNAVKCR